MEKVYPVMIDGTLAGKLKVHKEGAATVFDAVCRFRPGIIRLSVYGEGKEGYLGVLAPEGDELTLHKRLSPAAMRAFPETIDSAERSGRVPAPAEKTPEAGAAAVAEEPPPIPEDTDGLNWYASPDGALVCFDGECSLIALPQGDSRLPPAGGVRRTVEGREYRVFRTRRGKLVY